MAIAHPSKNILLGALVLTFLALVFAAVAMSIPSWSRIPGTAPIVARGSNLLKVNTATVTDKATLNIGLYQWCLDYGDDSKTTSCSMTSVRAIPAHAEKTCSAYLQAVQVLAPVALACILLTLIVAAVVFKTVSAWKPEQFWKSPKPMALLAFLFAVTGLIAAVGSIAVWILLAERQCTAMAWNPMQGYSTGFIFQCFTAGFMLLASLAFCMAMAKLDKVPVQMGVQPKQEPVMVAYPETGYPEVAESPYMIPVDGSYVHTQPVY